MQSPFGQTVFVEPTEKHTHTFIFLHGRDYTGAQMAKDLFDEDSSSGISLRQHFPSWRWVFPTAPDTYNERFQENMHQWFYIYDLEDPSRREETQVEGLTRSVPYVHRLITNELSKVPAEHLFLGGMSLGCATALAALLSSGRVLGGFVGLFGWLPFEQQIREMQPSTCADTTHEAMSSLDPLALIGQNCSAVSWKTPILLSHNADDVVVPVAHGRSMRDTAIEKNATVRWTEYPEGDHWIKEPEGVDDIIEFLTNEMK